MINIAIFASGSGSNAEAIASHLNSQQQDQIKIACIISDVESAYVHERARRLGIPSLTISKETARDGNALVTLLTQYNVQFIVLAGYLRLIPKKLVDAFPRRIINIHPALLPKYGGKGMYGMNVHKAVHEAQEKESGITIHLIDEEYDRGEIILQAKTALEESDTPETIAQKVHHLEYLHFPHTISTYITENSSPSNSTTLPTP